MKKQLKKLTCFIMVTMMIISMLGGCGKKAEEDQNTSGDDGQAQTSTEGTVEEASQEPITIELMQAGWVNTGTDENDPYQKYINDTYNVDFQLNSVGADFDSQYMVRFASDNPPDIIVLTNSTQLNSLYQQQVVVEDWNQYLDKLPSWSALMNDNSKKMLTTDDGKLESIVGPQEPGIWGFKIRQDWLNNLGLKAPTTLDELMEVARAFTNNDPDQNGQNDTYAFTSAGSNYGLGEIAYLKNMFGPTGFYLKDGKVSNEILDGNEKLFLDFMRQVVAENLIDPDWYTINWNERKAKLFSGTFGICYYSGALAGELETANGADSDSLNWYTTMKMPKATENGGMDKELAVNNSKYITVSAEAAADEQKMGKILEILEGICYSNDSYWALRWGVGIENGLEVQDLGNGYKYINTVGDPGQYYRSPLDGGFNGAYDWGFAFSTTADQVLEGASKTPSKATELNAQWDSETENYPRYGSEVTMLSLNPDLTEMTNKIVAEFEIRYILGETNDYDTFVANWRKNGGDELLAQAEQQYKDYGFIQ